MQLTIPEFCSFSLKSKTQLLNKDGELLFERKVYDKYKVVFYRIYRFYVEMVIEMKNKKVLRIDPVINNQIVHMYIWKLQ